MLLSILFELYMCLNILVGHVVWPLFKVYVISKIAACVLCYCIEVNKWPAYLSDRFETASIYPADDFDINYLLCTNKKYDPSEPSTRKYQLAFYIGQYAWYTPLYFTERSANAVAFLKFYWFGIAPIMSVCLMHNPTMKKIRLYNAYYDSKYPITLDPVIKTFVQQKATTQVMAMVANAYLNNTSSMHTNKIFYITPYAGNSRSVIAVYSTQAPLNHPANADQYSSSPLYKQAITEINDETSLVDYDTVLDVIYDIEQRTSQLAKIISKFTHLYCDYEYNYDHQAILKYCIPMLKKETPVETNIFLR